MDDNGSYARLHPSVKAQSVQSPGKLAETVEQEAEVFWIVSFPQPLPADFFDNVSFLYPQLIELSLITVLGLQESVKWANAGKVLG